MSDELKRDSRSFGWQIKISLLSLRELNVLLAIQLAGDA